MIPLSVPAARLPRLRLAARVSTRVLMGTASPRIALGAFRMIWSPAGAAGSGYGGAWGGYGVSSNFGSLGLYGTLPGTQTNVVAEVGDPALNSAVAICLGWIIDQVGEPRLRVVRNVRRRDRKGELIRVKEEIPNHPLLALLDRPNPHYDGAALWAAAASSYKIAGNAYWLKTARGAGGRGLPKELYQAAWWELRPRYPASGEAFITDYLYRPGGRGPGIPVPKEDVIHFRFGLNAYDGGRTGISPTFPILRSVMTDNEAETYHAALLKNMGIVGYAIMPADGGVNETEAGLGPEAKQELEDAWVRKFTGDGRGKPFVSSHRLEIKQLGLSPDQLGIDGTRAESIRRICAALRIHPVLVGLGGDTPGGFDNGGQYEALQRAAYQDCLTPMLARFARTLQDEFSPELVKPGETVEWDYSEVPCFQSERAARYARLDTSYKAGWLKRSEAREEAGLEVAEDGSDDIYATDLDLAQKDFVAGVRTRDEARSLRGLPAVKELPPPDQHGPPAGPESSGDQAAQAQGAEPSQNGAAALNGHGRG